MAAARPPLRVTHYGPTTFRRPELRVPHAVVVTVREEGRPPWTALARARSPLSTRVRAVLRLYIARNERRGIASRRATPRSSSRPVRSSRSSRRCPSRRNVALARVCEIIPKRAPGPARLESVRGIRVKAATAESVAYRRDNAAGVVATPPSHRVRHARLRGSPEHPRGASVGLTVPRR